MSSSLSANTPQFCEYNYHFHDLCLGSLLEGLKQLSVDIAVPSTVQQEAELVHLQQVARRRLIVGARQRSEVDDGRHGSLSLVSVCMLQGSSNLVHTGNRRGFNAQ